MKKPTHLLKVSDFDKNTISALVKRAISMKKEGYRSSVLKGKNIGLLFEKSSTRTRISFEVGVHHLGGNPIYLDAVTTQMSRGEPVRDSVRVLNHYIDGLVVRLFKHTVAEEMASYSSFPIINGLTDLEHPCQAYGDLMTLTEYGLLQKGKVFAFFGDANFNVANSVLVLMSMFGMKVRAVCPEKFRPSEECLKLCSKFSNVEVFDDPVKGAEGADVIYTDTWISMGMESEKAERVREFMPYQVNAKILSLANPGCKVMHCLPAYRGFELTADVLEANSDIIFEQAGNRLHIQKAILEHLYSE